MPDSPEPPQFESVLESLESGDCGLLTEWLIHGGSPDEQESNGRSFLHVASFLGNAEAARLLVEALANVDLVAADGCTPLHTAVHKRRAELVGMLLRAGARVDLLNSNGLTPLALAVNKENPEIVSELIRAGASADMSSNNNKDLVRQAIMCRQLSMARMLIDASAEIDEKKSLEWFKLALLTDFTEAVQLLIDAGVRLDQTGPMGLMLSFFTMLPGNASVRKLLLASGAEMAPEELMSFISAFCSAPRPPCQAAAPTVRSAEEQRQFSSRLSEAMRAAGFKQANAAVQSGAAAALQDILRDLMDCKDIFVFGSFADGWGSSLETLNGEISWDSDIDVTWMESDRLLCLDCGSAGWTACSGCGRDAIRVQCENGHAYYEHGSTGPNMATMCSSEPFNHRLHVNIDRIQAVPCCRYPRIELLQLGYSNRRGQPAPQKVMTEQELLPVTSGRPLGPPEPPQFDSVLESLESGDCGLLTEWLSRGGSPDEQDSDGRSFLHVASFLGNAQAARLLVEASANVDLAAADGSTPLHEAVDAGRVRLTPLLLRAGASPAVRTVSGALPMHLAAADGSTPLHEAVHGGSERLTRLLLRAGASPAVRTVSGALPMHLAGIIESGDDIARLLAGPTCAATDSRQEPPPVSGAAGPLPTPLYLCVLLGQAGAVDALTAAGADPNCCASELEMEALRQLLFAPHKIPLSRSTLQQGLYTELRFLSSAQLRLLNSHSGPAMSTAAILGNAEIVRILLSAAADPDRRNPNCPGGSTPLHEAARFGKIDIMSQLISAGVGVDITDERGFTPVHRAAESDSGTEAAAVLIRAGANVDSSSDTGLAPLHLAVFDPGFKEITRRLIGARANVDALDCYGNTPLHYAVRKRRAELVAMLLRAGARVDLLNSNGRTPLALAVYKENAVIVSELIRAGASADMSSNNNKDLVRQAIMCRQLSMARMLIDASADINEKNSSEWFAVALMAGFTEAVQLLIDAGVSWDQTGPMGLMLSLFTVFPGNASIRKLLLASGAEMPSDAIISIVSAFFSAPEPPRPAAASLAAPAVRSAEEQRQFSSRLSEAMRAAGFKQANAAVQSGAAAALQDILRDLMDCKDIFVFGSFADGLGSSLETLNGEISWDSDIDVTWMESDRLLCLDCGSAGWTACSGCGRDAIRVQCENGHAYYEHGSTGPNMATMRSSEPFNHRLHVNIDRIQAVPCCRYPRIELLQPGYSNRRGQPSQMSQRILNQLNQEALGDSPKCHAVAASPPHKPPGSCMRVSTTLLERAVMHSLTTVQGQFFILVKFLIKKVISIEMKVSGLKTYMAKNLLFYMLDETPEEEWKPDNLLQLVRQSLQLLVETMESSASDTVCMKHFFLRDADVYFERDQLPKKDIVDAVNGVIDELPRWLHQFQGQLRENASNSVRFEPFLLLMGFGSSRDAQRYSGYSSIYGLVRHCLLKLGSDRRGQSESEHLSELLQLIGELPDCARSARESLRLMAHLKFHAPLDAAGAAAELTGQESSGIECPESPGGGSELLSVGEAKERVWRHLEETDSATFFHFQFEEKLDFGFLPAAPNQHFIIRFNFNNQEFQLPVDFVQLHESLAGRKSATFETQLGQEMIAGLSQRCDVKALHEACDVAEIIEIGTWRYLCGRMGQILQEVPEYNNYVISLMIASPQLRGLMMEFSSEILCDLFRQLPPEDIRNLRAAAASPEGLQEIRQKIPQWLFDSAGSQPHLQFLQSDKASISFFSNFFQSMFVDEGFTRDALLLALDKAE
uniref:ANK_REP_REGION domain-containing protein n=1 Tax=Macrostomum lignano TaxID=282301 RepID=A0A1I8I217_9PLAT